MTKIEVAQTLVDAAIALQSVTILGDSTERVMQALEQSSHQSSAQEAYAAYMDLVQAAEFARLHAQPSHEE